MFTIVVTENGVDDLKGLSSTERAQALIGLADPAFQDELTAAAKSHAFDLARTSATPLEPIGSADRQTPFEGVELATC